MIRLHLIFVALTAAVSALTLSGADRPQHNFLFVVDSSLSMSQHKAAAIKLVRNVIASKFDDQIEPGDSIDVWTYDTENNLLGFPPQIWQPTDAARISDAIAEYLGKYRFKGSSDFGQVATDLTMLVPQTKGMLIVVITDGEKPFSGINRDLEINEYLSKKGKLGASNGPLLVSLAAINGDIRTWTTYFGTGAVDLATLPERTKRTATVAQTKPQAPPKAQPVQKPAPKAQHPPIPSTPIEGQQFVFNFPPGARVTPLNSPANKSTRLDKPFDISDAIKNVRATNPAPTLAELAASILAKKAAAYSNASVTNAAIATNRTIVQTVDSA
ncbi:MAG TPA: VWA domain-containing protein, partial [Candidatus Kapabacteria bacterium]|nr:VWA domain-containing protein [Candidatus Kapabacteria bacterium]